MSDIDNAQTPTWAHGTSLYHEISLHDANETESHPMRPLLHHQSPSLSHSYPESTFSSQSTENRSSYGQEFVKGAEPRTEGTPKKVLQTGWLVFLQSWLFHVPAVLSTIFIVYIGSIPLFWYPEQGPRVGDTEFSPSTIMNLLQVAAKIHEVLMVFSLSAIILAIYRRRLIGSGIRLGFLSAGYRVGDIGYLLSSPFWRQGLDKARPWEILLCGLFVFATLMSATVGPASAVLLTPSLDWFDFAPGTAFSNMASPLTYHIDRNHVWNPVMRAEKNSRVANWCWTPEGLYATYCPTSGFREMTEWVRQWRATNLASPILFQAVASDISRRLKSLTDPGTSVVLSTTPSHFLLNSVGLFQNYIAAENVGAVSGHPGSSGKLRYRLHTRGAASEGNPFSAELFQPFVQSICQIHQKAVFLAMERVPYPTRGLKCMGDRACELASVYPRSLVPQRSRFKEGKVDSDVTNYFVGFDNSTVVYLSGQISRRKYDRDQDNVYLCSAVASWIPANYTFDPGNSNVLESTIWSDESMRGVGGNASATGPLVGFTNSWLRLLNPWIDPTKGFEWSALEEITSWFREMTDTPEHVADDTSAPTGGNYDNLAKEALLATAVGAYLTEALARTSSTGYTAVKLTRNDTAVTYARLDKQRQLAVNNITVYNATHLHNDATSRYVREGLDDFEKRYFEKSLPIVLAAERYGYGTGQPRKTLRFAQAILATYMGVVCLYAAAIAAGHVLDLCRDRVPGRRRVLHVAAWSDL